MISRLMSWNFTFVTKTFKVKKCYIILGGWSKYKESGQVGGLDIDLDQRDENTPLLYH